MHARGAAVLAAFLTISGSAFSTPVHLRCESLVNPLGIDAAVPHLSWQSDSTERNWRQSAYQVLVASSAEQVSAGHADVWDSGKVSSDESVGITYSGPKLESRKRYYWSVRVWDAAGKSTQSSEFARSGKRMWPNSHSPACSSFRLVLLRIPRCWKVAAPMRVPVPSLSMNLSGPRSRQYAPPGSELPGGRSSRLAPELRGCLDSHRRRKACRAEWGRRWYRQIRSACDRPS